VSIPVTAARRAAEDASAITSAIPLDSAHRSALRTNERTYFECDSLALSLGAAVSPSRPPPRVTATSCCTGASGSQRWPPDALRTPRRVVAASGLRCESLVQKKFRGRECALGGWECVGWDG
jgi:hypothetical protein